MDYILIFEDLFKKDGPVDLTKWNLETGGHGFGNNESQYYTNREKNAFIKDGILNIASFKEEFENRSYTSAKLTTYNKASIKYGKVIVTAKLPKGNGMWPAIWMLPNSVRTNMKWPLCGEIDIMENVARDPFRIHFSLHTEKYNHKINTQITHIITDLNAHDEFIDYEMRWDEEKISFFTNNVLQVTFKKRADDIESWPFDQPFYLIINLAVGGNWGGEIDDSIFPQSFQIKKVQMFERKKT